MPNPRLRDGDHAETGITQVSKWFAILASAVAWGIGQTIMQNGDRFGSINLVVLCAGVAGATLFGVIPGIIIVNLQLKYSPKIPARELVVFSSAISFIVVLAIFGFSKYFSQ